MLTQMVELLIQQEPTLLAQRTVDTSPMVLSQEGDSRKQQKKTP